MKPKKNVLEWSVFAVSLVLIVAVVAVLVREALMTSDSAPDLRIETGVAASTSSGFRVPVLVTNASAKTAEQVMINVSLRCGDAVVERAEFTLDFVPGKSKRDGWVVFRHDPRGCTAEALAQGFEGP
ncbi:MAG: hypothetical protein ABI718_04645 [Acidobacteriota bacterium]